MPDRLVIAVLGKRNSGKSSTWNALFGSEVRTGKKPRRLYLSTTEWVEVFLVSGSPEERQTHIGEILPDLPKDGPTIVLCSVQYRADVKETFSFFVSNEFDLRIAWLNPGFQQAEYVDELQLVPHLIQERAWVAKRDGNDINTRCGEIRELLYGWARVRGLVNSDAK